VSETEATDLSSSEPAANVAESASESASEPSLEPAAASDPAADVQTAGKPRPESPAADQAQTPVDPPTHCLVCGHGLADGRCSWCGYQPAP
jgi:hypothetical protein